MIILIKDKYDKSHHVNLAHVVVIEPDPNSRDYEKRCWVTLSNGNKIHAACTDLELVEKISGVQLALIT